MAKRFLTPINLSSLSSDPVSSSAGDIYFNTQSNKVRIFHNSAWNNVDSVTVSNNPPADPKIGQLWYESDTGNTFIYYDDFWVQINDDSGKLFFVSENPPVNPVQGQGWFDNTGGDFYIYDGTYWQEAAGTIIVNAGNIDGGTPSSVYGGINAINGGGI